MNKSINTIKHQGLKEKIHNFFEQPKGFLAYLTQAFIFLLIILSVAIVVIEFFYHPIFLRYESIFHLVNWIILIFFTIEYALRVSTAPQKLKFIRKPLNIVDFLSIAPNYIELALPFFIETTELRVLRIIRLLRFARALRVMKLFKYGRIFRKIFQFQGTIFEAILPIMVIFTIIKGLIWFLESKNLWLTNADLGNLFAIIGFALGIILSQKIGVSYDKFVQVEEAVVRLYGSLRSLALMLDKIKPGFGTKVSKEWAITFLGLLENTKADNFVIHTANGKLYNAISTVEGQPADLAMLCSGIAQDAAFCLSKKTRITPKAYDTLLHQSTMLYFALITVFISGITGMISVVVATYILYGMYHLTQDLDSILGGDYNLINIDISELQYIVNN